MEDNEKEREPSPLVAVFLILLLILGGIAVIKIGYSFPPGSTNPKLELNEKTTLNQGR